MGSGVRIQELQNGEHLPKKIHLSNLARMELEIIDWPHPYSSQVADSTKTPTLTPPCEFVFRIERERNQKSLTSRLAAARLPHVAGTARTPTLTPLPTVSSVRVCLPH
jgi:hypothetical protein